MSSRVDIDVLLERVADLEEQLEQAQSDLKWWREQADFWRANSENWEWLAKLNRSALEIVRAEIKDLQDQL